MFSFFKSKKCHPQSPRSKPSPLLRETSDLTVVEDDCRLTDKPPNAKSELALYFLAGLKQGTIEGKELSRMRREKILQASRSKS
jgi:hypothetical protein